MKKLFLIATTFTILFMHKQLIAQETNKVQADEDKQEVPQHLDKEELTFREVKEIPAMEFFARQKETHPNPEIIDVIHRGLHQTEIKIFIGAWCEDSKEMIPKIESLFTIAGFPPDELIVYMLDEQKKSKSGIEKEYNVKFVPTIIFLNEGKELGRIVEQPEGEFDQAVYEILVKLFKTEDEIIEKQ